MPVLRLELENFKSYGGQQRIGPFTNFTCIIGPNGSGKSNLMDAISFVLGVQSKALRSQQLQDLIYREPGADDQEDNTQKSKRRSKKQSKRFGASVTLFYRVTQKEELEFQNFDDQDDEDSSRASPSPRRARRKAPTPPDDDDDDDSNDEQGRIIRFGRTISPAGVGEYQLDGKKVTWNAYERALAKLGVLVQARNFLVFQGDVEALARKTPAQLVQLVDVLSGSASYKDEFEAKLTEQQERNQATVLQWQTQKQLRQEKKLLKQQKQEAERFQEMQDEKRQLQTQFYLWQLYQINHEINERQVELQEFRSRVEELKGEQETAAETVKEAKKELSTLRRKLNQRQEDDLVRINTVLDTKEPALAAAKSEQEDLDKKLRADEKALKKALKKASSHQDELEKILEDIEKSESDLKLLEEEYDRVKEAATRVKWTTEQEEEYEKVKRQAKAASARFVTKMQQNTRQLNSAKKNAANLENNIEQAQSQLASVQTQAQELQERKDKLGKTVTQTKRDYTSTEKKLSELQKSHRASSQRRHELDLELETIQSKLRDAKSSLRRTKEEERAVQTVKNLKTFTSKGVYGRLVDLCRPIHKEYALAITTAAGRDMDSIVVDTPQTAQTCIQYLREQRVGTATFLPLSNLSVPSHESTQHLRAMLSGDERFRLAVDIIKVVGDEPEVQKAVQFAVGNTVVCDDMGCARELSYNRNSKVKTVTLSGGIISKVGAMTGGLTKGDGAKSNRWKHQEVEKWQAKFEEISKERAELDEEESPQAELENLQNRLGTLSNKKKYLEADVGYSTEQHKEKVALISNLERQIEKMQADLTAAQEAVEKAEKEVEESQKAVRAAEEEHYQPFRERSGLTDLQAYDQAMGKSREEFQENKRVLTEHMTALKQKKEYEENRDVQKPIKKIEARIKERQETLDTAQGKQLNLEKDIEDAQNELKKAKELVEELENEEKDQAATVAEAQKALDKAKGAAKKAGQEASKQETALERLRGKLHEVLQKARVEEVELPTKRDDEDSEEEEDSEEDEEMDEDDSEEEETGGRRTRSRRQRKKGKKRKANEDEDEGTRSSSQTSGGSDTQPLTQNTLQAHFSQADNQVVVRDREKASMIDFSDLPDDLKQFHNEKEDRKVRKRFDDQLSHLTSEIESASPNMKAGELYETVSEKCKLNAAEYEEAKSLASKASQDFENIKAKRTELFLDAFEHIDNALKTIYTDMTKSSKHPLGGNAYLSLDDTEEPYNGGLKFNAMPPMKRFRDMEQLSGGEKTVAALSLLFAIHSFRPAPFFIMDEVDAALDNINLRKVCNYIRRRSQSDFQVVVISLKDMFYEQAEALVGICRDAGMNSSRTVTLDLTKFDANSSQSLTTAASSLTRRKSTASSVTSKRTHRSMMSQKESVDDEEEETVSSKKKARRSTSSRQESVEESEDEEEEAASSKKKGRRSTLSRQESVEESEDEEEEEETVSSKKKARPSTSSQQESVEGEEEDDDDEEESK